MISLAPPVIALWHFSLDRQPLDVPTCRSHALLKKNSFRTWSEIFCCKKIAARGSRFTDIIFTPPRTGPPCLVPDPVSTFERHNFCPKREPFRFVILIRNGQCRPPRSPSLLVRGLSSKSRLLAAWRCLAFRRLVEAVGLGKIAWWWTTVQSLQFRLNRFLTSCPEIISVKDNRVSGTVFAELPSATAGVLTNGG